MFLGLDSVQAAILAITALAVVTIWGVANLVAPRPRGGHLLSGWELLDRPHHARPHRPRHSHRA